MKALIAGGGIGGVTAALCMLEAGIDVELYERNSVFAEAGAGLQISPNGVKVLRRLNLANALDDIAFRPEALEMRLGLSGKQLFSIPMGEDAVRRYGAPYLHVHRVDLLRLLVEALRSRSPRSVNLGREATGYTQGANAVRLVLAGEDAASGDVLVGADGIHSCIRTTMLGEASARFTGNVAWRLVVPATEQLKALVPPTACIWVGPGRHAVTYYLRRGELVNFVGVVESGRWCSESWMERGEKSELVEDFRGWAAPVAAVIAHATECYRWALFDRDPFPRWTDGRVTLLGDACHPMLPFLAQGAVMAIEDGWVLSRKLRSEPPDKALAAYERVRKPRTSRVQLGARSRMPLYHMATSAGRMAYTSMWLASKLAPSLLSGSQDWLYAHDVTSQA